MTRINYPYICINLKNFEDNMQHSNAYLLFVKRSFLLFLLFFSPLFGRAQDGSALIPQPNSLVALKSAPFRMGAKTAIVSASPELASSVEALQGVLKRRTGREVPVVASGRAAISLTLDATLEGEEHYRLEVDRRGIRLSGATPAAVFRGVMTLDQLLLGDVCRTKAGEVTAVVIDDTPRFAYRALMLDPARNFLPVEAVKHFIDQMAKYKFNVLQLHLSDDQGWRIALQKYPGLSSRQAYSQEDIRELIRYAGERYIEVVPEIDIPGHTAAFLSVYPELGCVHRQSEQIEVGKTVNRMLCAANPRIYDLFGDIIGEVAALFPSAYIHLGGDEAAVPENWAKCDSCKALMARLGYERPSQLMIPFFGRMLDFVRASGKKPILWCELNNIYPPADDYLFPYPSDVTLVSWRGGLTPTCLELTRRSGHPLIMAPGEYAYLDYPQLRGDLPEFNNWGMPVTTLTKCYEFDPGYGRPAEEQAHVMGVMGTLWGEAIKDVHRVTYMAFPRALALSEAGWTQMDRRDWTSFKERLFPNLSDLMQSGVSIRVPFEIVEQ